VEQILQINLLKNKILLILFLISIKCKGHCDNAILIPPIPMYLGARPLGMGNAFVSVADDENALFDNAAGIGYNDSRNQSKSIVKSASFPNITFATNSYTLGLIGNYFNSSYQYPSNIVGKSIANSSSNDLVFSRISLFPNVVIGRFQLGFLADSHLSGYTTFLNAPQTSKYSTTSNPFTYDRTFSIFNRNQYGPVAGFSLPISKHIIIGIGVRFMERGTIINTIEENQNGPITPSLQNIENNINRTNGFAFDTGIIIPFQNRLKPKIALSFLDVGDTTYNASNSSSVNEVEKMNTKAGISINPSLSKNVGAILSIEEERINDSRVNDRDKIRAGFELSFGSYTGGNAPLSIRTGYGMQTFSAGMSLYIIFATIDFATYGETVPISNGYITDRRYVAKFTVDL
jgi:hypothetical protein